jgi:hypothetical protein
MSHTHNFIRGTALAVFVAIGGSIATPVVALADANSTAALIAIGAIVGTLIYDSSRQQYYYVNNDRHRVYVNNETAQGWYQRQDPQFYHAHQSEFRNHPQQFDQEYRSSHHGHPPQP